MIIFLLIAITIYGLVHFYLYHNVVTAFSLSRRGRLVLGFTLFLLALSFFAVRLFGLYASALIWISYIWFGIVFIAFTTLVVKDLLRVILRRHNRILILSALVTALILSAFSLIHNFLPPRLVTRPIELPTGETLSAPISVVHLSDLHIQTITSETWLSDIVERVNALKPDFVMISGDLLDEGSESLLRFAPILHRLNPTCGTYVVPGNHDFYSGIDFFMKFAEASGMHILRNELHPIPDLGLFIAGMDDVTVNRMGTKRPPLSEILKEAGPRSSILLLTHRPDEIDQAAEAGVDIYLAGHLHAGQIPPMDLIMFLFFRHPYGLYLEKGTFLNTSSGTGWWGPPMRLFRGNEIVHLLIRPKGIRYP